MMLEENSTNLLEPQWGNFFFFFFHVVWRDNLDILTLGPVSPKIFKSKSPLVPGSSQKDRGTPLLSVQATTPLHRREHRGQRGDGRSGCTHSCHPRPWHLYGFGKAGYFTSLSLASWGEIKPREGVLWLQQPGRDAAQGNTPNAMVRSGVVCIRVESNPLLTCFLSFCCLPYVSASFFAFFFFFAFVSDLSLSDLSLSVPISRH